MSRRGNSATNRLRMDYMRLKKDPLPYIAAEPLPSNILEWRYVVTGPESSPFAGGFYHGKLVFPSEYPFKPPSIYIITPNGRFKPDTRLCLSISDYHPDTWNPAWSVGTILTGLLSFMLEKTPTLGSVETSDYQKKNLARKSHEFNLRNKVFVELFPEAAAKSTEFERKRLREERLSASLSRSAAAASKLATDVQATLGREGSPADAATWYQGAVANFLVIGGFAAFAYLVQYIMTTLT